MRRDYLETFDRAQNRDRRGDDAIAVEERCSYQSESDDDLSAHGVRVAPLLLKNERQQRENAALAVVVRTHNENDVLDADDDYQRPHDQREDAVDVVGGWLDAVFELEAFAQRVKRTGTDVPVDDA